MNLYSVLSLSHAQDSPWSRASFQLEIYIDHWNMNVFLLWDECDWLNGLD